MSSNHAYFALGRSGCSRLISGTSSYDSRPAVRHSLSQNKPNLTPCRPILAFHHLLHCYRLRLGHRSFLDSTSATWYYSYSLSSIVYGSVIALKNFFKKWMPCLDLRRASLGPSDLPEAVLSRKYTIRFLKKFLLDSTSTTFYTRHFHEPLFTDKSERGS